MTVARSQWLTSRNLISDWLTNTQAENKSRVQLQWQSFAVGAHPLFFAVFPSVTGLQTLGHEMTKVSRWTKSNVFETPEQTGGQGADPMEGLWDALCTEDGRVMIDEETARPIGITVGRGFGG